MLSMHVRGKQKRRLNNEPRDRLAHVAAPLGKNGQAPVHVAIAPQRLIAGCSRQFANFSMCRLAAVGQPEGA